MKELFIFAGVNGAGKSTFYIRQLENDTLYGARVNSDELVREFGDWKNPKDQNRAAKLAIKLRQKLLSQGATFNLETTLSGKGIVKFIQKAKDMGYFITLFYVGLSSVEISKQRVAIRTLKNGHSIDETVLIRRFKSSYENLAKVLPIADKAYIYDNSDFIADENEQKFSNLKEVAVKDSSGIKILSDKYSWFNEIAKGL